MEMEMLTSLGFSKQDLLLITFCPLFAVIGGLVHFILLETNFSKLPRKGRFASVDEAMGRTKWIVGKFIVSAVTGLVLALYFVGALVEGPTVVARILAFAILLGYVSDKIWHSSDKAISQLIEDKIKELIPKANKK